MATKNLTLIFGPTPAAIYIYLALLRLKPDEWRGGVLLCKREARDYLMGLRYNRAVLIAGWDKYLTLAERAATLGRLRVGEFRVEEVSL